MKSSSSRRIATSSLTTAKLIPVRMDVPRLIRGRPGYSVVDGFKIVTPNGAEIQPYMRKQAARNFCRELGWKTKEVRGA